MGAGKTDNGRKCKRSIRISERKGIYRKKIVYVCLMEISYEKEDELWKIRLVS